MIGVLFLILRSGCAHLLFQESWREDLEQVSTQPRWEFLMLILAFSQGSVQGLTLEVPEIPKLSDRQQCRFRSLQQNFYQIQAPLSTINNNIISDMTSKQNLILRKKPSLLNPKKLPQKGIASLSPQLRVYFDPIFESTHQSIETLNLPYYSGSDPNYTERTQEVEWMFSAQIVFQLGADTVFLAVQILDKIISEKGVEDIEMSKMAMVSLILATKQNDVIPLHLRKVNQISRTPLSKQQFIDLEAEVLELLDFQLPQSTIYQLFKLYQIAFQLQSVLAENQIILVLKRCVQDYKLLRYGAKAASLAALTSLCCIKRILVDTAAVTDVCHYYEEALNRIDNAADAPNEKKRMAVPEIRQHICV